MFFSEPAKLPLKSAKLAGHQFYSRKNAENLANFVKFALFSHFMLWKIGGRLIWPTGQILPANQTPKSATAGHTARDFK